jgi:hypothetical protein
MRKLFICCIFFAVSFSNVLAGDWIDAFFKADHVWYCADGSRTYMVIKNGNVSYPRMSAADIQSANAVAAEILGKIPEVIDEFNTEAIKTLTPIFEEIITKSDPFFDYVQTPEAKQDFVRQGVENWKTGVLQLKKILLP